MTDKPKRRGQFVKNDPRRSPGGRPKKTTSWKEAEDALREAIPRILMMEKNALTQLLASNPTGVEMLAAKYIHEHVPQTVDKFLGKTPNVLTGADGKDLIPTPPAPILPPIDFANFKPEQIDSFIAATASAARAKKQE